MRASEDRLPFRELLALALGAVWQHEARCRGCGVGSEDGEFPSLADTIAAVRRELSSAQAVGQGQLVQFRTGPVELEFEVAVTRTRGGEGGVQIWVLTLGGKLERGHATTQRIKVTLHPVDAGTGQDARIADASRGSEPAGPPP
jgi:hypothetical protein